MKCQMINVFNQRDPDTGHPHTQKEPCTNEAVYNNPDGDVKMCQPCFKKMVNDGVYDHQDIKSL